MHCVSKIDLVKNEPSFLSRKEYRLIAENAEDMIIIIDPETLFFKYVSPSNIRIMGYTEEEFLSRSCLENVHPDDREYVATRLISAIKENATGSVEYRCIKKDGSYIWLETNGKMYESSDCTFGAILISRDIERRKLIEQKLRQQLEY